MITKLKCILLDDELPGLTYLKMLCSQLTEIEVVKAYNQPELMLEELGQFDVDLFIMDIEMPGLNGLEVANLLQGKPIIFTTAYSEFAAEAFDLNAIDYVRKPVKRERLLQAIQKAQHVLSKTVVIPKFVQLNSDKGKTILHFEHILHIKTAEQDSRDKIVLLKDLSEITLKNISFERLKSLLPVNDFCQVNKQEIVALKTVRFFSFDEITTSIKQLNQQDLVMNLGDAFRRDFIQKASR